MMMARSTLHLTPDRVADGARRSVAGSLRLICALALLLGTTAAWTADLSGRWKVSIANTRHEVIATLQVRFTEQPGRSCMGGEWRELTVVEATTRDPDFFPVSEPLSYQLQDGLLVIGRNEICDAYLWLKGPLHGSVAQGEYLDLGLRGSYPRGSFTAEKLD